MKTDEAATARSVKQRKTGLGTCLPVVVLPCPGLRLRMWQSMAQQKKRGRKRELTYELTRIAGDPSPSESISLRSFDKDNLNRLIGIPAA
jgi:hypothetical protein